MIEEFLDAWSETEPPQAFFYWSMMAAASAIAKRNVYLPRPPEKPRFNLYPNIYVLLIAKSGMKKSLPPIVVRDLVAAVGNTKMLDGRASFQSMLTTLGTAITSKDGKAPLTEAAGLIVSEEFSTAFVRDEDVMTILTKLYDSNYNKDWSNTLKGSGREELKSISITLLGAMNQPHFNDLITLKDIEGGFIARCLLVYERKRNIKNSLMVPTEKTYDPIIFVNQLKEIAKLKGPFVMDPDAICEYDKWYYSYESEDIEDRTGTANRLPDQILKVGMNIALVRRAELRIKKDDIEEAMDKCFKLTGNIRLIVHGVGESKLAVQTRIVMTMLLEAEDNKVARETILRNHSGRLDWVELDQVIENFMQQGILRPAYVEGKKMYYQLKPGIKDKFTEIYSRMKKVN